MSKKMFLLFNLACTSIIFAGGNTTLQQPSNNAEISNIAKDEQLGRSLIAMREGFEFHKLMFQNMREQKTPHKSVKDASTSTDSVIVESTQSNQEPLYAKNLNKPNRRTPQQLSKQLSDNVKDDEKRERSFILCLEEFMVRKLLWEQLHQHKTSDKSFKDALTSTDSMITESAQGNQEPTFIPVQVQNLRKMMLQSAEITIMAAKQQHAALKNRMWKLITE